MKGSTVIGVALIAAVAIGGVYVWKQYQSSITVRAGGVTAQLGAAGTAALVGGISNLGTSLGNALAGSIGSLFGGGSADNVDLTASDLSPVTVYG